MRTHVRDKYFSIYTTLRGDGLGSTASRYMYSHYCYELVDYGPEVVLYLQLVLEAFQWPSNVSLRWKTSS